MKALIECSIASTPAIAGGGTWIVRVSAGSAPHQNAEIHVFVPVTQAQQCQPGDFVQCYSGDPATRGIGLCRPGVRTCLPDGTWSSCQGEVLPTDEICGDGLDNDCDRTADEGCSVACRPDNACDDGNPCTTNDVCSASGVCGGTPVLCATLSSCTVGTCDPASGGCVQMMLPDGTVCSVGETNGVCLSGQCVSQ